MAIRNTLSEYAAAPSTKSRRRLRIGLGAVASALLVMIALEIVLPGNEVSSEMVAGPGLVNAHRQASADDLAKQLEAIDNRRLFEPSIPLPARSMAKKSVDRIREQLSLHGITRVNGRLVAYIGIKGTGLQRFRLGDGIEDLFTVTRIDAGAVEQTAAERSSGVLA